MYLLRKEQQREASRSEDERRAQAARVSAWLETRPTAHGGRELLFHVHNASDMPIYEVELPMPDGEGEGRDVEFIGLVPPGQTIRRPAPAAWLRRALAVPPVIFKAREAEPSSRNFYGH